MNPGMQPEQPQPSTEFEQQALSKEFQALLAVDAEEAETYRRTIWNAAEIVSNVIPDDARRQAVERYAAILEWQYCAPPGSELPPGLVLLPDRSLVNPGVSVEIDYRVPFMQDVGNLVEKMLVAGCDSIVDANTNRVNRLLPTYGELITRTIRESAVYRFFMSFDSEIKQPEELPLNDYWRQVREAQIREAAKSHRPPSIAPDDRLDFALQRRLQWLDEETMPPQAVQPKSRDEALLRAQNFFRPLILDEYSSKSNQFAPADVSIEYEEDVDRSAIVSLEAKATGATDYQELNDYLTIAVALATQGYDDDGTHLRFVVEHFAEQAIDHIFNQRLGLGYHDLIEDAVQQSVPYLADVFSDSIGLIQGYSYAGDLLAACKLPTGNVVDRDTYMQARYAKSSHRWEFSEPLLDYGTGFEIARQQRQKVGQVTSYGPAGRQAPARLIASVLSDSAIPLVEPGGDLTLEYWNMSMAEQPYVPGYVLRGETVDGLYCFDADEKGDPYTACTTVIGEQQQKELQLQVGGIGLINLAEQIATATELTIDRLVRLVAENSHYYVPLRLDDRPDMTTGDFPHRQYFRDLQTFAMLVKDGKLQVQCSGADVFLAHCLQVALEEKVYATASVSGNVINPWSPDITAVGHAQTMLVLDGRRYILDATPASTEQFDSGDEMITTYGSGPGGAGLLPINAAASSEYKNDAPDKRYKAEQLTPDEKVERIRQSLVSFLMNALQHPTEHDLKTALAPLPDHDPARRSLQTVLQWQSGELSNEILQARIEYIELTAKVTRDRLVTIGMDHYSPHVLDQLAHTARQLGWAAAKASDHSV